MTVKKFPLTKQLIYLILEKITIMSNGDAYANVNSSIIRQYIYS